MTVFHITPELEYQTHAVRVFAFSQRFDAYLIFVPICAFGVVANLFLVRYFNYLHDFKQKGASLLSGFSLVQIRQFWY